MAVHEKTAEAALPLWHASTSDHVVAQLASNVASGLSGEDATRRLARDGPNALRAAKPVSWLAVFISQFKSPLIYLLFATAAIALALRHWSDALVIFSVVLLNALIGAVQEGRAEKSLQAIRKLAGQKARVLRDRSEQIIDASDVVAGDILVLQAGDAVAADVRLLDGAALQLAEAALTGESVAVLKQFLPVARETSLADRSNMAYAGTHVVAGRAHGVVVATGLASEIGHIAALAETTEQPKTPLERRIDQFGRSIIRAAACMFLVVCGLGWMHGLPLAQVAMIAISQTVGMIPEGLPVAMTIALAVGVQRMARRNAIVRRLAAVETLGATTIICSDKTGTLTRNEMTVTAVCLPSGRELAVTGTGYQPIGQFFEADQPVDPTSSAELGALIEACVLCNDAQLQAAPEREPAWTPLGDPTEVALVTLAIKAGCDPQALRARSARQAELPFDSVEKLMATQHAGPHGPRVFIKGAPEVLLDAKSASATLATVERWTARALRVLAVGVVDGLELDPGAGFAALRGRIQWLGLIGQIDPPRAEVKAAVERCWQAGIRPVVVTGDHKATGWAVAKELGIARDGDAVLEGRELAQLTDAQLAQQIDRIAVFARVQPAQKLRIVAAYQQRGHVVAMTGDGVNDAPALVEADVGVAMGMGGSEVAKEAANIVITDDNFATIMAAVEEGRIVYRNMTKAVLFLFSTSLAEVGILLACLVMGYAPPFVAVQILWNNLVTEGLVTVNLVMEPAEGDEMTRPPIAPDMPLLSRALLTRAALMVATIVITTLVWFVLRSAAGVPPAQVRTETFTLLVLCEWFNVLNCRSEWRSALNLDLFRNRWLITGLVVGNLLQVAVVFWRPFGGVFHTVPIPFVQIVALGAAASAVLWVEEIRKLWVAAPRLKRSGREVRWRRATRVP